MGKKNQNQPKHHVFWNEAADMPHFVKTPFEASPKMPLHVTDVIDPFETAVQRQVQIDRAHLSDLQSRVDCLGEVNDRGAELRIRCELAAALTALRDLVDAAAVLPAGDVRASVLSPLDSWRAARAKINLRVRSG